ncbi:MAG: hypothetical protein OEY43_04755 [Gammaproteobacteria bacterium]|nr:hypothetical protein [Gammaproteobacteria bacterium]
MSQKKQKKRKKTSAGSIISAIIFGLLMGFLIVFAMYYDPGKQYHNSFFDDVSEVMKWKQ